MSVHSRRRKLIGASSAQIPVLGRTDCRPTNASDAVRMREAVQPGGAPTRHHIGPLAQGSAHRPTTQLKRIAPRVASSPCGRGRRQPGARRDRAGRKGELGQGPFLGEGRGGSRKNGAPVNPSPRTRQVALDGGLRPGKCLRPNNVSSQSSKQRG